MSLLSVVVWDQDIPGVTKFHKFVYYISVFILLRFWDKFLCEITAPIDNCLHGSFDSYILFHCKNLKLRNLADIIKNNINISQQSRNCKKVYLIQNHIIKMKLFTICFYVKIERMIQFEVSKASGLKQMKEKHESQEIFGSQE